MAIIFNNVSYFDEIKRMNFKIDDGKITGVAGSLESGKSLLFDLMTDAISPTEGKIITTFRTIGKMYQSIDNFLYSTIGEELYLILKLNKNNNINKRILDSLKMAGLNSSYINRNIYSLSYSEQKKALFALSISINPQCIILDEPFEGLDKSTIDNIIKIIRLMKIKYKKTVIIFSKDADIMHRICDEIVLIKKGELIGIGDSYSIFSDNKLMKLCDLSVPKVIKFSQIVKKKKHKDIGYRKDIDDLIKDIYRFVR